MRGAPRSARLATGAAESGGGGRGGRRAALRLAGSGLGGRRRAGCERGDRGEAQDGKRAVKSVGQVHGGGVPCRVGGVLPPVSEGCPPELSAQTSGFSAQRSYEHDGGSATACAHTTPRAGEGMSGPSRTTNGAPQRTTDAPAQCRDGAPDRAAGAGRAGRGRRAAGAGGGGA